MKLFIVDVMIQIRLTFMDLLLRVLFVFASFIGIVMLVDRVLTPAVRTVPIATQEIQSERVELAGTLSYQVNNVGVAMPYIVYKTGTTTTQTKAIVFQGRSRCVTTRGIYPCALIGSALPVYYDFGPVVAGGTIELEHIVVDRMTPYTVTER
jgi:hypothetical protein